MLRYFYIILLLVWIKWCFCDEYISNQDLNYRNVHNKLGRSSVGQLHKSRSDERKYREIPDYEEEEEEAPVDQIDVASFISSDNREDMSSDAADDDSLYELQKESTNYDKSFEGNYGTSSALKWDYNLNSNLPNEDYGNNKELAQKASKSKKIESRRHNLRFNREMNIGELQNFPLKRSQNEDSSDLIESRQNNINIPHHPQKKCTLKHMRIPFFSHDKPTKVNKKGKKRKFFDCLHKKTENKKEDVNNANKKKETMHGLSSGGDDITADVKIKKRSLYKEFICPVCKSVFKSSEPYIPRVRRLTNVVHNSRQFYASGQRNPKDIEAQSKEPEDSINSLENLEIRLARQSSSDENVAFNNSGPLYKNQQLRELEEVERRINEIGERTKTFEKPKHNF